ncbi:MAG: lactate racemase domain-containing protein [Thermoguttaceae bacterium]
MRQTFEAPRVDDVEAEVEAQLARLRLGEKVSPGQTVAISAGSRGISHIHRIIRAIAGHLKSLGAEPFVVPAMGTHGNATAEGQQQVIESYGVTEAFIGCPIRASMDTVVVCETPEGIPVHFDRYAYEADHVVVCGRVKPHTGFTGDIESGLMKMMLIGLGKCNGAAVYHAAIQDYSFGQIIRSVAGEVLEKCRILAGVAIVENAYDETGLIEAVAPEAFESREKELLVLAKQWLPRLPFPEVDVLLIDRIGKNISGVGFDANVVGRKYNDHRAVEGESPKVKRIALRGLTEETHGNSIGIGLAEFCKSQLLRETDFAPVRLNALISGHVSAAMIPLDYETDREMLEAALSTIGMTAPPDGKLLWIHNTLELGEVECSAAYLDEARDRDDLEILIEPRELPFDAAGHLPDMR